MNNRYLEHPDITRTLKTGYPSIVTGFTCEPNSERVCPLCDGALAGTAYEIDGREVCGECFKEWVEDYISTNPREVANALGVEWYLI